MARRLKLLSLALTFVALGCRAPVTENQRAMSSAEERTVADSVRALTRRVLETGESLDVDSMVGWFRDGPGAAFGGASGLMLSTGEFRDNLERSYSRLRGQQFSPKGERVVVLAPDAAVVTGLGGFVSTDTLGRRGFGNETYTFVWTLADGKWKIVQAHFSSNLMGVDTTGSGRGAPR